MSRSGAGIGHEIGYVEDRDDLSRAQNRHAGDVVDLVQMAPERLDHDLLFADERVDDESHPVPRVADRRDGHLG